MHVYCPVVRCAAWWWLGHSESPDTFSYRFVWPNHKRLKP